MPDSLYARRGKPLLDAVAALAGLVVLSPLFLLIAAAVALGDPGPVFFRHERVGRGFRRFAVLKFRTMRSGTAGAPITKGGDPRVTGVGRFLRRTKLDELPQLLNVLRGEMSLVGPRPEVPRYVEEFRRDYEEILSVRPGLTDYAAIEFRDEEAVLASYPDPEEGYVREVLPAKIALYRRYLREMGLATDLRILWKTALRILA